jgi:STE24 endopeptidase
LNFIAVIVLAALGIDFILHFYADVLNLRHMSPELPPSFRDVYDAKRYAKSQKYLRVNTHFDWIVSAFNLFLLLCFWFLGGFSVLDGFARGFQKGPVFTGIVFAGVLILLKSAVNIPFGIYATFVIEEKFGFNKTTWKTYILDKLKVFLLAVLLGIPLLSGILAFFEYSGKNAWWYCWVVVALFTLLLRFVGPTWIMPLFNKYSPLKDGELKQALFSLAERIRFPLKNVFVMDGSRRSTKSNAFFTGFGRNKRIVLFDTLIEKSTVPELVAVMAHEMGHYKLNHIWVATIISILHMGLLFFLLSLFISLPPLFEAFFMESPSVYGGMIFFGLLYSPVEILLGILLQFHSRMNEFQADRFAVEKTGEPNALAVALKKLSAKNLSNLTPHPFYAALNYSHPPILKRIEAITGHKI